MAWPIYRPRVTIIDVLEDGIACESGIREFLHCRGIIAGPTADYPHGIYIQLAAFADGESAVDDWAGPTGDGESDSLGCNVMTQHPYGDDGDGYAPYWIVAGRDLWGDGPDCILGYCDGDGGF